MRKEDVREKLLLFYEGKTSQEDERELYIYFSTEIDLPEDLETDKDVFLALFESNGNDSVDVPCGFEAELNKLIDGLNEEEKAKEQHSRPRTKRLLWIGGVAASLIFVLALGIKQTGVLTGNRVAETEVEKDTFSDPKEAYKATEEALLYTSAKMNKVLSHLEKSSNEHKK